MIKTIIFDFGGVLVDWNPHHLYDGYFGNREKADWFLANICNMDWNSQMDAGKPFAVGVAELSAQFPDWKHEIEIYYTRWIEMMGEEIPGMKNIIQYLKSRGFRILGLSNWSAETFCQVRNKYEIFDLLDGMLISGHEHMIKPNEDFFRLLLERFSVHADECIFVDDNLANVDAASRVGMHAIHFINATQLKSELERQI